MPTTATRLLTLITLLQRRPGQKAGELAAELGVSARTLHRYFGMLDEMGIPVFAERGPYGGFSLVRGYKLPPLIFTPEEAVAIHLGTGLVGEMWGRLYREAATGALAKIESVLPDEQREEVAWARRSLAATGMNRSDLEALAPVLETLRHAVRERHSVSMRYRSSSSPQPPAGPRRLDPYALVHRWGWWYVVGYCHRHRELRWFRADRIEQLDATDLAFSIPADFDVREYIAREWQSAPQIHVRMRFAADFAHLALYNRAFWEALSENADGTVEVTLASPDITWAASYALAYGPAVTVLEPEAVRRTVREWAQATAGIYEGPSSKGQIPATQE